MQPACPELVLAPALLLAAVLGTPRDAGTLRLPAPLPPPADPATQYELHRQHDGGYAWDCDAFSVRIAPDGAVQFRDHRTSAVSWLPFRPIPAPNEGPSIQSTLRDLLGGKRQRHPAEPVQREAPPRAMLFDRMSPQRPDPTDACKYPMPCAFEAALLPVQLAGRFDVTDELVRLSGHDPYSYEKAKFLAATRDVRVRLAVRAHAAAIRRSSDQLPARLEAVAADERLSRAERAALLRAFAEEIDVSTAAGRTARARIDEVLERRFGERPDAGEPQAR